MADFDNESQREKFIRFCHFKPLFRLINVKKQQYYNYFYSKIFVKSDLIAIFAAILQNQVSNDIKNRI